MCSGLYLMGEDMPDAQVILELGNKALLALGGGGVVVIAVCAYISNYFANSSLEKRKSELGRETERLKGELAQEAETHKLALKKQELIFNKEVEAASAFIKMHREIMPKYSHPDMDWDDACEQVASEFGKTEGKLEQFIVEHGAIVIPDAREMLSELKTLSSHHKFHGYDDENEIITPDAKKKAGELIEKLVLIEEKLIKSVRN